MSNIARAALEMSIVATIVSLTSRWPFFSMRVPQPAAQQRAGARPATSMQDVVTISAHITDQLCAVGFTVDARGVSHAPGGITVALVPVGWWIIVVGEVVSRTVFGPGHSDSAHQGQL